MPVIQIDPSVQVQVNKGADLTAKKAGDLAAATVHLFTNDVNPGPQGVVGDFVEAAYAGYAAVAVAGWTANNTDLQGNVSTDGTAVISFTGPVAGGGPLVYGYYVLSAGGGTPLIYYARFTAPFSLADNSKILSMVPTFTRT